MADWPPMMINTTSFIADMMGMSAADIGATSLIMMAIWQSKDCRVPDDAKRLQRITKVSAHRWPKVKKEVQTIITLNDGWWSPEGSRAWRMVDWTLHPCRSAGSRWREIREVVLIRDNHTCQYCGDKDGPFDVDHVMPKSRGGTNDYANLVAACYRCNRSKGDKTPEEWQGGSLGAH